MSIVRPSFQHWGPNSGLLCKKQIYQLKTKNTPCEVEFLIDKNFPKSGPNVLYTIQIILIEQDIPLVIIKGISIHMQILSEHRFS